MRFLPVILGCTPHQLKKVCTFLKGKIADVGLVDLECADHWHIVIIAARPTFG
jgi:hypothetical protein